MRERVEAAGEKKERKRERERERESRRYKRYRAVEKGERGGK